MQRLAGALTAHGRRAVDAGIGGLVQAGPVGCFIRSPLDLLGSARRRSLGSRRSQWACGPPQRPPGARRQHAARLSWRSACGTGIPVFRRGGCSPYAAPHHVLRSASAPSGRASGGNCLRCRIEGDDGAGAPVSECAMTAVRIAKRGAVPTAAPPCGSDRAAARTRMVEHALRRWAVERPGDHHPATPRILQTLLNLYPMVQTATSG